MDSSSGKPSVPTLDEFLTQLKQEAKPSASALERELWLKVVEPLADIVLRERRSNAGKSGEIIQASQNECMRALAACAATFFYSQGLGVNSSRRLDAEMTISMLPLTMSALEVYVVETIRAIAR